MVYVLCIQHTSVVYFISQLAAFVRILVIPKINFINHNFILPVLHMKLICAGFGV